MWFRCCRTFDHYFITNLLLSLFWKNFWSSSIFGKVVGEKWIASSALYTGALSCWKMNSLEIWHMASRNYCNSIMLRLILLTNLDSVIDKCQTGVMLATCYLTNAVSDWMLIVCTGVLSRHFFFLVDKCAYSQSFCGFYTVVTVNIFLLVNKRMLTSFGECFWATFFSGYVLYGSSLHSALQFLNTNISQGSVATWLRCGGIFNYYLARNVLLSLLVKEMWKLLSIWQS